MAYRLIEKSKKFSVEETKEPFGEICLLFETNDKEKAKTVYRNVKRGGCFNGWTPLFFIST